MPMVPMPGGGYAIVCTRGRRPINCHYCGRPGGLLCDFPLSGQKAGQTCDAPLCHRCTWSPSAGKDYCRPHRTLIEQQAAK